MTMSSRKVRMHAFKQTPTYTSKGADNLSGRYTVRCNLAEIVVRVSSYNDKPRTRRHTLHVTRAGANE